MEEKDGNNIPQEKITESHTDEGSDSNKQLTTTLLFGTEEKILSKEEKEKLVGGIFWIEQYGQIHYCKVIGVSTYNNTLELKYFEPTRPSISADQEELANILREHGCNLIHEGRSGFASRNHYTIYREEKKEKKMAPLIIIGNDTVWTGTLHEKDLLAESEVQIAKNDIEIAKQELLKRRMENIEKCIAENKKGDISIISVGGGPEDFHHHEIPNNYIVISERRIGCTQDHRRNMSHTYEVILIDKKLFEGKSYVKIEVPDGYKGLVIGKGGSTIKNLSQTTGCTISVK